MVFDYPYTDMHELNLDWFLAKFKDLVETWNNVESEWNSLHDYVQNYFDNLDVQDEINNKIQSMIDDNSFATILTPLVAAALPTIVDGKLPNEVASQIGAVVAAQIGDVVAGQLPAVAAQAAADEVSDWLAAHVDPDTGYVIDSSLTISLAAADAKVVGDSIYVLKGSGTVYNNTFINNLGNFILNNSYSYEVFTLNKGDKISIINATSPTLNVVSLLATSENNNAISSIKNYTSSPISYSYTAVADNTTVYVSYVTASRPEIYLYRDITDVFYDIFAKSSDYYSPKNLNPTSYIAYANGNMMTLADTYASEYLPVSEGDTIILRNIGYRSTVDARGLAFYDNAKQYVSGIQYPARCKQLIVTVPANAKYIRITIMSTTISDNSFRYIILYSNTINEKINAMTQPVFDISMFDNIGVCGDSYTKAQFYDSNGVIGDNSIISWGKILGRLKGIDVSIYASSGADTDSWQSRADCLPKLLSDPARRLYIFNLGINDYTYVSLGTAADMAHAGTDADPFPNTYYGNYASIITQILASKPDAKIILMKCWLVGGVYYNYSSTAIEDISQHFGIPYIDPADNSYFTDTIWTTGKIGSHPTATQQSGMAKAVSELVAKCIQDNKSYFDDYFPA